MAEPTMFEGEMAWDGRQLAQANNWTVQLTTEECETIARAVAATKLLNKPIGELTSTDFNFGAIGDRLLTLRDEVLHRKGFIVLRGLCDSSNGRDWSDEDLIRAYWGIGQWFGEPVSQNAKAHLLGHVIDQRKPATEGMRIYQTNQAQPFHSDSCDIVGLLCMRTAKSGGVSSIASSAAIHNTLLERKPELLDVLYSQFDCDRYNEIPAGKLPYYTVRVFNNIDGNLVCCGMDPDIRSAQRLDCVSRLTRIQIQALDEFQSTARELALNMMLERGDIQLVNNLTVVHARGAFEDHEDTDQRRYLVRLWLSSPLGRTLPQFLAERWGNIAVGTRRGGIRVPGAVPAVHMNPNH